ncbi:MAG: hypothetical protein ACKV22_40045 [Bryobacteraceae bacterium]
MSNPEEVLRQAVARAVKMLDDSIGKLVDARNKVCQGATPAAPLLSERTLCWLRNRLGVCVDDIRMWTAHDFVNGSVGEVIRRLVRVRNLIANNVITYVCRGAGCGGGCDADDWAYVCLVDPDNCPTQKTIVHLCHNFWEDRNGFGDALHKELQALAIIHEASHLYHCTSDRPGSTVGVAYCLVELVAVMNGISLDGAFLENCVRSRRCGPPADCPQAEVAGLGFIAGPTRIFKAAFNPQKAVRLKGSPAMRTKDRM